MGLNTWKQQRHWEQDHELARELLLALRSQMDAFRALRSPFVWAGEMQEAVGGSLNFFNQEEKDLAYHAAISRRVRALEENSTALYPLVVEADVLWSTDLEKNFRAMRKVHNDVVFAFEEVQRLSLRRSGSGEDRKKEVEVRKVAFGLEGDDTDSSYLAASVPISDLVKQKLGRGGR